MEHALFCIVNVHVGLCCFQSARREVPDHIQKPDYAETGLYILLIFTVYQEDFVKSLILINQLPR